MDQPQHDRRLPYPTRQLKVFGGTIEEYIIPEDKKQEVFNLLYLFAPVPALDEQRFDLREGKIFSVREFRVVREDGKNFLVSPYYPKSGGSVIDWMPADFADED